MPNAEVRPAGEASRGRLSARVVQHFRSKTWLEHRLVRANEANKPRTELREDKESVKIAGTTGASGEEGEAKDLLARERTQGSQNSLFKTRVRSR